MTPTIREPAKVPKMVPTPPVKLVPPMIAPVMASNSYPTPAAGCPEFNRAINSTPPIAEKTPQMMKAKILMRRTLIPAATAASSLPPIA